MSILQVQTLDINRINVAVLNVTGGLTGTGSYNVTGNINVSSGSITTGNLIVSGTISQNGSAIATVPVGGVPKQVLIKNSTTDGDVAWANTGSPVLLLIDVIAGGNTPATPVSGYSSLLVDFTTLGNGSRGSLSIYLSSDGGSTFGPFRSFGVAGGATYTLTGLVQVTNTANTGNKAITVKAMNMAGGSTQAGSPSNTSVTESSITSPTTHVKFTTGICATKIALYGIR